MNKYYLLHKKYANNKKELDAIWSHCQGVWQVCQELASSRAQSRDPIDLKILKPAALLHDIGVYIIKKNNLPYIKHAIEGAKILKKENFSQEVIDAVLHHVGSGITKQDIINQKLPLPKKDFLPLTSTERLLAYADKFAITKTETLSGSARLSSSPGVSENKAKQIFQKELAQMRSYSQSSADRFLKLHHEFGLPNLL